MEKSLTDFETGVNTDFTNLSNTVNTEITKTNDEVARVYQKARAGDEHTRTWVTEGIRRLESVDRGLRTAVDGKISNNSFIRIMDNHAGCRALKRENDSDGGPPKMGHGAASGGCTGMDKGGKPIGRTRGTPYGNAAWYIQAI